MNLWQIEIAVYGENLQPCLFDSLIIAAEEKVSLNAASLQERSVIQAKCPGAYYRYFHKQLSWHAL
jgi:hypothetical protein